MSCDRDFCPITNFTQTENEPEAIKGQDYLSMGSNNESRTIRDRNARTPKRTNGIRRVAVILKAGEEVIAEKGYESATMAEIAARSDTRIGSLYRFFPGKEALANALIDRYRENIDLAFDAIDAEVVSLSVQSLADRLLGTLLRLHPKGAATFRLMEARPEWSIKREELRSVALRRIAQTLRIHSPRLEESLAQDVSTVLLLNMKSMKAFAIMSDRERASGALRELHRMNRLYLENILTPLHPDEN